VMLYGGYDTGGQNKPGLRINGGVVQ